MSNKNIFRIVLFACIFAVAGIVYYLNSSANAKPEEIEFSQSDDTLDQTETPETTEAVAGALPLLHLFRGRDTVEVERWRFVGSEMGYLP